MLSSLVHEEVAYSMYIDIVPYGKKYWWSKYFPILPPKMKDKFWRSLKLVEWKSSYGIIMKIWYLAEVEPTHGRNVIVNKAASYLSDDASWQSCHSRISSQTSVGYT